MVTARISGRGVTGLLRLTWLQDGLGHVLDHCDTDEPAGTWTGLAGPDHALALGSDVDNAQLRSMCRGGLVADMIWEAPDEITAEHYRAFQAAMTAYDAGRLEMAELLWQDLGAIWSLAWAANYTALELLQKAGISKFAAVKPQRWVVASFEHHCSPHGLPRPHVHNIVVTGLTAGYCPQRSSPIQRG